MMKSKAALSEKVANDAFDSQITMTPTPSNSLNFTIQEGAYQISFDTSVYNTGSESTMAVSKDDEEIFVTGMMIPCDFYYIDIGEELELEAGNLIAQSIQKADLDNVNKIIENSKSSIFDHLQTDKGRKLELFSNLFFHKSILTTASRGIVNNGECECTPHPFHLGGKTYFLCTEDDYYDVDELKSILVQYQNEGNELFPEEVNLANYLNQTSEEQINFDKLNSFNYSKADYMAMLENIKENSNPNLQGRGGCGWYCPIGCGSDHGCCGNYSGCCIYRHLACYVHDKICIDCEYEDFCLPGCKPGLVTVIISCG